MGGEVLFKSTAEALIERRRERERERREAVREREVKEG